MALGGEGRGQAHLSSVNQYICLAMGEGVFRIGVGVGEY